MSVETSLGHEYDPADQKEKICGSMIRNFRNAEMHIHTAAETSLGHYYDPADQANILSGNLVPRFPHFFYLYITSRIGIN